MQAWDLALISVGLNTRVAMEQHNPYF